MVWLTVHSCSVMFAGRVTGLSELQYPAACCSSCVALAQNTEKPMIQKHGLTSILMGTKFQSLLYDLKDKRRYWKFKEEAQGHTLCRTHFRRDYALLIRQTTEWMNVWRNENFNENHTHTVLSNAKPTWIILHEDTILTYQHPLQDSEDNWRTLQDIQYKLVNLRTIVNLQTTESVFKFWWNGFKKLVLFEQKIKNKIK